MSFSDIDITHKVDSSITMRLYDTCYTSLNYNILYLYNAIIFFDSKLNLQ